MRFRHAFLIALIGLGVPVIAFEYLSLGMLTIDVISPALGVSGGVAAGILILSICFTALVIAFVFQDRPDRLEAPKLSRTPR